MALPSEKLAQSLDVLKKVQEAKNSTIIRTNDISRTHLERLIDNRFLMKVVGGWFIQSDPSALSGDTTAWYISYWNFISEYIGERLGEDWCLSPEVSLDIQTGNWTVLPQLTVRSPKCSNSCVNLIFGCSIYFLKADCASNVIKENRYGLNVYSIPEALVMASPNLFRSSGITMRTELSSIKDSSDILPYLLDKGRSSRAGRLIGAFKNVQMATIADEIQSTMTRFGYTIREEDPFDDSYQFTRELSPYATRLRLMWRSMRDTVFTTKPDESNIIDTAAYMKDVEYRYKLDAYHSLSIEGYRVTEELIEKVRSGKWNPENNPSDKEDKAALAARGYWQAFQEVKKSLASILNGANAGSVVEKDHRNWYQEMFAPAVMAGIIKASDIAGYRTNQVYIRNSMHTPLNPEAVRDAMPVLFDLLKNEDDAWVRAVLGHFIFTFIHPYMDGNGRMGRFLMNVMLASGGYRWTIIRKEIRDEYMSALERASVQGDISSFAELLAGLVDANGKQ